MMQRRQLLMRWLSLALIKSISAGDVCKDKQCAELSDDASLLQRTAAPCDELQRAYDAFNTIGNGDMPGGLLFHGFDDFDIANLLNKIPSYRDMDDCAQNNRHTCSAWSYLRRDLAPMVFLAPGKDSGEQLRIGIIVDASKVWSLMASLSVINTNSDNRNACSNNVPPDQQAPSPLTGFAGGTLPLEGQTGFCLVQAASAAGVQDGDIVYQPPSDSGAKSVSTSCAVGDEDCRAVNAGGCQTTRQLLETSFCINSASPEFQDYQSCFDVRPAPDQDAARAAVSGIPQAFNGTIYQAFFSEPCSPCTQPFRCVPSAPGAQTSAINHDAATKRFVAFTGPEGERWAEDELFWPVSKGWFTQCPYSPRDTDAYVGSCHALYSKSLATNGEKSLLYANPASTNYLQSEVNMYIDGDTSSKEYAEQEQSFFAGILGLTIDRRLCSEILAPWNNVTTTFVDSQGTVHSYSQAGPRCQGFGAPDDEEQRKQISLAEERVRALQKQFSKKAGRHVPIFESAFGTTVGANNLDFQAALAGQVNPEVLLKSFK